MSTYHKLVWNGYKYYRILNEVAGFYERETFKEEELKELVLQSI